MTGVTPPHHLFCLRYTWQAGSASASTRELFLSETELIDRIDKLYLMYPGEGQLTNLVAWELLPDTPEDNSPLVWARREVERATPTRLGQVVA